MIVRFDSLFCHSNGGHFFLSQIVVPLLPVLLEFISKVCKVPVTAEFDSEIITSA